MGDKKNRKRGNRPRIKKKFNWTTLSFDEVPLAEILMSNPNQQPLKFTPPKKGFILDDETDDEDKLFI